MKISVIIPTFSRADMLPRAIHSVLDQQGVDVEVVVVNDNPPGSSERERTREAVQAIGDARLLYVENEKNLGGSLTRNQGILASSGAYISFLDDDDYYRPGKLSEQLAFTQSGGFDLTFMDCEIQDEHGHTLDLRTHRLPETPDQETLLRTHLLSPLTPTMTYMFRREALLERFPVVHGGNLMDKSLSRNIISAPVKIQDDFVAESARLLKMIAAQYRLHTVALDLSAGSAIADPVQKEALRRILRRLYPFLLENGQTLLLPFRLPVLGGCSAAELASFLRETMIPSIKVRLDIYPHELKKNSDPREIAGNLRFETRSVIFCYDADGGNRLLRAHLVPWLKYFALNAFYGPYFVCPFSQEYRLSPLEAESYSKLVEELKHKQE